MQPVPAIKITQVIITNFKSFKNTVKVGPFLNLTAIVGPNGGGKSNVIDAILYALGLNPHEIKHKVEDIVCKYATNGDPTSVEIQFEGNQQVLSIKREMKASTSYFYINDKLTTHQEYLDILCKNKINPKKGLFVIRQGEIVSIAQKSAIEMPMLIERISGSGELKNDYENHKKQIEELNKKKLVLSNELKDAKEQSKRTKDMDKKRKEYNEVCQDIESTTKMIYVHKVALLDKMSAENEDLLSTFNIQIESKEAEIKKINAKITEIEKNINSKADEQIEAKDFISQLNQKISLCGSNEEMLLGKLAQYSDSIKLIEVTKSNAIKEEEMRLNSIKELETQIHTSETNLDELNQNHNILSQSFKISLSPSLTKQYYEAKSAVTVKTNALLNEQRQTLPKYEFNQSKLKSLIAQQEEHNKRIESNDTAISEHEKLLNDEEESVKKLEYSADDKTKEAKDLTKKKEKSYNEKYSAEESIKQLKSQINLLNMQEHQYKKAINERIAIDELKKRSKGVLGIMQEYIEPPENKYDLAIKVGLSSLLDCIVVKSEEDHTMCNNYFLEKEMNQRVIVLDKIKEFKQQTKAIKDAHYKYLDEIIEVKNMPCRNEVLALLKHYVNNIAIADNIKMAITMVRKCKHIVTLNGEVIKKGIIRMGVESRLKQIQLNTDFTKEISTCNRKIASLTSIIKDNDLEEVGKLLRNSENEVKQLQAALNLKKESIKEHQIKAECVEKENETLKSTRNSIEACISNIKSQLAEQQVFMDNIKDEIENIENKEYKDIVKKLSLNSIKELEGKDFNECMQLMERISVEQQAMESFKQKLEQIKLTPNINIDGYEEQVKSIKIQQEDAQSDLDSIAKSKSDKSNELNIQSNKLEQINKEISERNSKLKETTKTYSDIMARISQTKYDRSKIQSEIDTLASKREDIAKEVSINSIDITVNNEANRLIEDYAKYNIEFDKLNRLDLENEIRNISIKLDQLTESKSKFNILALHVSKPEQTTMEEDVSAKKEELESLNSELSKVHEAYDEIKKERKALFMECYEKIKNSLGGIYKQLTHTVEQGIDTSGVVSFTLSETEEPYLAKINYVPIPSKKQASYSISQLSYGEKSIAAIALAFALQKYCESPFIILDEVDAHLDVTNTKSVISGLTKLAAESNIQVLCISHNEDVQSISECLLGIAQSYDVKSSNVFSLDMRE